MSDLDLTFRCNDLDETISYRDYFKKLLVTLWVEEERFSGKRPWGNSGWQYDPVAGLIDHGIIKGTLLRDEDGYIEECDFDAKQADKAMVEMINSLAGQEND